MRLNLSREPEWLELVSGVRVKVAPATSAVMTAVRQDPVLVALRKEAAGPEGVALEVEPAELAVLFAKLVAQRVILEWEGVEDDDGNPAPVTAENVAALLDQYLCFEAWQVNFMARWLGLESEKNGSAPLPTGTSAGAEPTARPVRKSAPTAQGAKTGRKR